MTIENLYKTPWPWFGSVTTCYSAGAARYWEAAGDTRRAALVRRQLGGLERARGQITTVADLAAARRTER